MNIIVNAFNERNEWVNIENVPNGINCNCFCPCCGERLIAKNDGKEKIHHFAHEDKNMDCGYGNNNDSQEKPTTLLDLLDNYKLPFFCHNGFKYFYIKNPPRNEIYAFEATKKDNKLKQISGGTIINKTNANKHLWQICGEAEEKNELKKKYRKIQKIMKICETLTDDYLDKIIEDCEYFANKHLKKNQSQRRA